MFNIINNTDLLVNNNINSIETLKLCSDNYIVLAIDNSNKQNPNKEIICLSEEYIEKGLDFINNHPTLFVIEGINLLDNNEYIVLNKISFEKIYHKQLTKVKDSQTNILKNDKDETIDIDEKDLLSVLNNNNNDILINEESAPIIKFVNSIFFQAIRQKASDIHIENHENKGVVRFRINGVLVDNIEIDSKFIPYIITRIKVISDLDIGEKRKPQDGRTQIKIAGKKLDIRVSILPNYYGERIVMRILMDSTSIPSIEELGFDKNITEQFNILSNNSHGIILVTGPTGSGKSTTLHAFLKRLTNKENNIMTIEDPVEYKAERINQMQVNSKIGLSFAEGLRSILRQDPDIIMVGEIRDKETAEIAIQAALTGHLVFSTLHTNTSIGAIIRLMDMGIEPFLISSSVIGVVSQRLAKILCNHCKKEEEENSNTYLQLNNKEINFKIYKEVGCPYCNHTGYTHRKAVGECLILDNDFKKIIKEDIEELKLRKLFKEKKLPDIKTELYNLLANGLTSFNEIIKLGYFNIEHD